MLEQIGFAIILSLSGYHSSGTAIAAEIRREIEIAKARMGNDWHLLSIVDSWGDSIDNRETLQASRTLTRTGSTVVNLFCTVH